MNAPGCSRSEPPARAAWPRAWHMPVQLRTGSACSADLPALLQGRRAVVLAFAQAEALGARQRLLPQAEWLYVPDGLASLDAARALSARLWPLMDDQTALVALGGGTVMDLAKWLRHRPALGFEALCEALREGRPAPGRKALLVLLPSTAGTGSEVSRSATLWDLQVGSKLSLDPAWADAALVDPDWTHSVPLDVTLDSGLDALAHALEALWNRQAQPLSDALALAAARTLLDELPRLLRDPGHRGLREAICQAALQAGMAMGQTRSAIAHALSGTLTLQQRLPHGRACAHWLPRAWRAAQGRCPALDARLHALLPGGAAALGAWLDRLGVSFACIEPEHADDAWQQALRSERGRNFIAAPQLA